MPPLWTSVKKPVNRVAFDMEQFILSKLQYRLMQYPNCRISNIMQKYVLQSHSELNNVLLYKSQYTHLRINICWCGSM